MNSSIQYYLNHLLSEKLSRKITHLEFQPAGGGSINDCFVITTPHDEKFFLKLNSSEKFPLLFEKEKSGLEYLGKKKLISVPQVIDRTEVSNHQLLLMEWIEAENTGPRFWKNFGEQLAKLHQVTNTSFGFELDNYMGALPQDNRCHNNWVEFFIHYRLQPQIKMGKDKNLLSNKLIESFEKLYPRLDKIFNEEKPSLLHGDLWSGNYICGKGQQPFLIDPAVYYGHRSIDLGMTTLFGGFDKEFYEAYNYHFPFPENYKAQWEVCNLYPLLIHLNLFGSSYLSGIERILLKYG